MSRKLRNGLIITVVLVIAILTIASFYALNYSIAFDHRGKDIASSFEYLYETYPFTKNWIDSLRQENALKDTFIINREGKQLHAYYVASPDTTPSTAVIIHGYTDNAVRMMMIGYLYNRDLRYNILLPDLQNHGKSEGPAIQMGWKDRLDVMEWMEVANRLFGHNTQMVVHGISMGAATTMMISGEKLPGYVKCFVEDCGYTSVWEQFAKEIKERFGISEFPILYTSDWLCQLKYGWGFKEASCIDQLKKATHPMLFIHGDADKFVPTEMVYPLYETKSPPKELWVVEGAEHAASYRDNKEEYTNRVKKFVDTYNR